LLLAAVAAVALAALLLTMLHIATAPASSNDVEGLPPTGAVAATLDAPAPASPATAPGATVHSSVNFNGVAAEEDPSARAVAAY
jgi:hypothetical protein